jgi:hypothetical protein
VRPVVDERELVTGCQRVGDVALFAEPLKPVREQREDVDANG